MMPLRIGSEFFSCQNKIGDLEEWLLENSTKYCRTELKWVQILLNKFLRLIWNI